MIIGPLTYSKHRDCQWLEQYEMTKQFQDLPQDTETEYD